MTNRMLASVDLSLVRRLLRLQPSLERVKRRPQGSSLVRAGRDLNIWPFCWEERILESSQVREERRAGERKVRDKPGIVEHFWQRLLCKTESLSEVAGPAVAEKYRYWRHLRGENMHCRGGPW